MDKSPGRRIRLRLAGARGRHRIRSAEHDTRRTSGGTAMSSIYRDRTQGSSHWLPNCSVWDQGTPLTRRAPWRPGRLRGSQATRTRLCLRPGGPGRRPGQANRPHPVSGVMNPNGSIAMTNRVAGAIVQAATTVPGRGSPSPPPFSRAGWPARSRSYVRRGAPPNVTATVVSLMPLLHGDH
jgi:hypothetical protein